MKHSLLCFLLLSSSNVHAAFDCFPSTWIPVPGLGTPYQTTVLPYGYSKSWFCQLPARLGDQAGKLYWHHQIFSVHTSDQNLTLFKDAALRVANAAEPLKQANIEVAAANVLLVPGTQKHYEYKMLRYTACKDLQLRQNWPSNIVFDFPSQCLVPDACELVVPQPVTGLIVTDTVPRPSIYELSWCGPVPVPPTVTASWITSGTSSYNTANNALAGYAGSIQKGLACNDSIVIRVGTYTYKNFAGSAKPSLVAQCTKVP
jgi:hypothetical protein